MGLVLALVVAVATPEILLRVLPASLVGVFPGSVEGRGAVSGEILQLDEELGFRPVPGGSSYDLHGALRNDYAFVEGEKPARARRLLFVGDSVTHRGRILAGLRAALGEEGFEYWNAGVEGYGLRQEVEYYRRYLADIRADHVLLTFCMNDFESTPVFFETEGKNILFHGEAHVLRPWLFEHSYLYRFYVRRMRTAAGEEVAAGELRAALDEMARLVEERGARFTVLVAPWCLPFEQWPQRFVERHAEIVGTLDELDISHATFLEALARLAAAGAQLGAGPGDTTHPGRRLGMEIGQDLVRSGFSP